MPQLVANGFNPNDNLWQIAKTNTMNEYQAMLGDPSCDNDIVMALDEFLDYCNHEELKKRP